MERASPTDAELVRAVADRDRGALNELYRRHEPWVRLRLARRTSNGEAVELAVQDTFVTLWKIADRYRDGNEVGAWIWGIAVHELLHHLRPRRSLLERLSTRRHEQQVSAEELVLRGVQHGALGPALAGLSPELRAVVEATVLDGLTTKEAGALLGIPAGTVKTRMMRAKAELRSALGNRRSPPAAASLGGLSMTNPTDTWHVPERALVRYVAGTIDPVSATSVESHVVTCAACQERLGQQVRPSGRDTTVDATWAAIADTIDRRTAAPQRMLGRLERQHPMSAVAFGSPALRWCGALALGLVALLPLVLNGFGLSGAGLTLFFVLAPLTPLAGIAASYSVAVEPVGELALATPARTVRLLLWRGSAVLAISVPIGVLVTLPFSAPAGLMLGWILPALGLCAITTAAATWRDPVPVAVGLAGAWALTVILLTVDGGRSAAAITIDLATWAPTIQIISLVAIVVGVVVAASRRDAFEQARFS